ncbi:hypothetical protein GCM10009551_058040 [Nocardiopsis tropica]
MRGDRDPRAERPYRPERFGAPDPRYDRITASHPAAACATDTAVLRVPGPAAPRGPRNTPGTHRPENPETA